MFQQMFESFSRRMSGHCGWRYCRYRARHSSPPSLQSRFWNFFQEISEQFEMGEKSSSGGGKVGIQILANLGCVPLPNKNESPRLASRMLTHLLFLIIHWRSETRRTEKRPDFQQVTPGSPFPSRRSSELLGAWSTVSDQLVHNRLRKGVFLLLYPQLLPRSRLSLDFLFFSFCSSSTVSFIHWKNKYIKHSHFLINTWAP